MQNAGQSYSQVESQPNPSPVQPERSFTGAKLVEMEPFYTGPPGAPHGAGAPRVAGISAAWRKLLLQAEMAAPHVQVASIEGESGVGKQTLARYLLSRSPLTSSSFQRRDAREWLLAEADPATITGFTYLDRVDLLAPPGQGLLLGVLKHLQDRSPGRVMLVASSQASLRQMAGQGQLLPDLAFRLTAVRFAIPPLRTRREDIAPIAQTLLDSICARYQHRPVTLSPVALAACCSTLAGQRARAGQRAGGGTAGGRERRDSSRRSAASFRNWTAGTQFEPHCARRASPWTTLFIATCNMFST